MFLYERGGGHIVFGAFPLGVSCSAILALIYSNDSISFRQTCSKLMITSISLEHVCRKLIESLISVKCHKLWIEICEIRQIFKGDLIKFCEIRQIFKGDLIKFCEFCENSLEHPQNSQKPLIKCKKLVINTIKCDLCLFLHKICCMMSENSVRFEKSYGNWFPDGSNSVRFYLTV